MHAVHMDEFVTFKQPYLARKSEGQLVMYWVLLLIFVSQKDSREAPNFILGYLIVYIRDYSYINYSWSALPSNQNSNLLLGMQINDH